MDCLRQAYPHAPEATLQEALDDADGDVIDALDELRVKVGEPHGDDGRTDSYHSYCSHCFG